MRPDVRIRSRSIFPKVTQKVNKLFSPKSFVLQNIPKVAKYLAKLSKIA